MPPIGDSTSPELELLITNVIDAAYVVYRALGPGLLESVYELCLMEELAARGIKARRQVLVPIKYRDKIIDAGLTIDILVEEQLILELKAAEKHNTLYEAQLMTYMKLSSKRVGLLINFNVQLFKNGLKRIIL